MQPVLTIDPKHRLVEGVASDGTTIWVSSILDRQILACRTTCRTLATLPPGLHPFAIAWDGAQKRLWVAADCPPGVPGVEACDRGALLGLDEQGTILTSIAPESGSFHPGDVSASATGAFVSDSQNGTVYFLTKGRKTFIPVVQPADGGSAQGTALSADGKRLLVADYGHGVGAVDLLTGTRKILPRADGTPLQGIDGLVRCGGTYYGIFNGSPPGKLVAINPAETGLTYTKPLGDDGLTDPTQIAFDGKRLLIVEDSGWETLEKSPSARAFGARIVAVPLGDDCKPN